MSGNQIGYLKGKMGLKGPQKPGSMIKRLNEIKKEKLSQEVKPTIKKII